MKFLKALFLLSAAAFVSFNLNAVDSSNAGLAVKKNDMVAIVGDSITEQKRYSKFIEAYLLATRPDLGLRVIQLGWGGERAPGFVARMENDLMPFRPNVVTLCYGMNDGSYTAYNYTIGKLYEDNMRKIIETLKKANVSVIVGTPGAVDTKTWRTPDQSRVYNENLGKLGEIDSKLAKEYSERFADLHPLMLEVMKKAKAAYGDAYHVAGPDGVHPLDNGHLVMAYAFLKAMGFDGNIGTVTLAWNGKAEASEGHKIISFENGKAVVESSRYPFCFQGPQDKAPANARSILPFLPFNQDLNRFTLVVTGLPADKAEVKWGNSAKVFTKEQLEKGINLADEFQEGNPFCANFSKLMELIGKKQAFETVFIKKFLTFNPSVVPALKDDQEGIAAINTVEKKFMEKEAAFQKEVSAVVVPVKYDIEVKPIK